MIFIFHGKDTYHSRVRLNEHVRKYRGKSGSALGMQRIDCEKDGVENLKRFSEAQSLFSEKKLIVAENFLHDSAAFESVMPALLRIAEVPDPVIFLWERGIGKDVQKKFSKLFAKADVQTFDEATGHAKQKFIEQEAKNRGITLAAQEREQLFLCRDAWGIVNTLDVLALGREGGGAGAMRPPLQIFALGDTFHSVHPAAALSTLFELIRQGEDEFGMFGYISGYTRTLLLVKAFAELREPVPAALGIHPFVLKKTAILARNLPLGEIIRTHANFFEEDARIKTGITTPRDALTAMLLQRAVKSDKRPTAQ